MQRRLAASAVAAVAVMLAAGSTATYAVLADRTPSAGARSTATATTAGPEGSAAAFVPSLVPSLVPTPEPSLVTAAARMPAITTALSPASTPSQRPAPAVLAESNTGPGSEPNVVISPFDSSLVAVTHQRVVFNATCDLSGVRVSRDGGSTWWEVAREPWRGYCPDFHGQVAWGPRPGGGSRLWWVDAILLGPERVSIGVTYSDDLGKTWAPLYINPATPPWVGGFPDITVDTFAESPSFGTVYVAYNWLAGPNGPGVGIIASKDAGASWSFVNVPAVGLAGFPACWRIGYRIKASPDGSAFVAFYENDLRTWSADDIFNQGGGSGRLGFATARITFGRTLVAEPARWAISLAPYLGDPFNPQWQAGFDVDRAGRVWLAVADFARAGVIHVGYTDSRGGSWEWQMLTVAGKQSYKPSLAVEDGVIFVGWHAIDAAGLVSTYYSFSYDDGVSFLAARRIGAAAWSLPSITNGTGLRESADFVDDTVRYAWGDNRGALSVFVASIRP